MAPTTPDPSANKLTFVLGLPLDTRPTDVVAKAKEAGISVSSSYVSRVQARARSKAAGGKSPKGAVAATAPSGKKKARAKRPARKTGATTTAKKAAPRTPRTAAPEAAPRRTTPAEDLLRAVAAEIGIAKAIQILETEHRRIAAILRG